MASRRLNRIDLDPALLDVLHARGLATAKDVICRPELDLLELLDVDRQILSRGISSVCAATCPSSCTAAQLLQECRSSSSSAPPLASGLLPLDAALGGGLTPGLLTEVVGGGGLGKTQLCLQLALLTAAPRLLSGAGSGVLFMDTDATFSSQRLVQMAQTRWHQSAAFALNSSSLQSLISRITVVKPASCRELLQRLSGLESDIINNGIRLLVIDSLASLARRDFPRERIVERQELLGQLAVKLKFLAETFKLVVVVTNQLSSPDPYIDQDVDGHSSAALGTKWAHCVNVRFLLRRGNVHRSIVIQKSPMVRRQAFQFEVVDEGITKIKEES